MKKTDLPLLIINFDGVIGDILYLNPFSKQSYIKLILRKNTEKAFKFLGERYQIALLKRMKNKHFNKFKTYFSKQGIYFDAIYNDDRTTDNKYPLDYSNIIKDFSRNEAIVLSCYDIDAECNNESILSTIGTGQLPLCAGNFNIMTVLIPHIKLTQPTMPNMEQIASSINKITQIINSESPKIIKKNINVNQQFVKSHIHIKRSIISLSKVNEKEFPPEKFRSLNNEFFIFRTDYLHKWITEKYHNELKLELRLKSKKAIRKAKIFENSKPIKRKHEILSKLIKSKLNVYTCIHLANQFKGMEYGKLSEADNEEVVNNEQSIDRLEYLRIASKKSENEVLFFVIKNTNLNYQKTMEVIEIEEKNIPYLDLSKLLSKRIIIRKKFTQNK